MFPLLQSTTTWVNGWGPFGRGWGKSLPCSFATVLQACPPEDSVSSIINGLLSEDWLRSGNNEKGWLWGFWAMELGIWLTLGELIDLGVLSCDHTPLQGLQDLVQTCCKGHPGRSSWFHHFCATSFQKTDWWMDRDEDLWNKELLFLGLEEYESIIKTLNIVLLPHRWYLLY